MYKNPAHAHLRRISVALAPPKPNELVSACSTFAERRLSHHRESAGGIRILQRCRRRQPLLAQRHQANHRFHRARRAQQMTDARFRGTHRQRRRPPAGPAADGIRLRAVVHRRARPVRVDIINVRRSKPRALRRGGHGSQRRIAVGMRLRQMMRVEGTPVARNLAKNARAAPRRIIQSLQRQNGRAFAQRQSVALRVERTALSRRQRLQGIEPRENKLAQGVVAAGQHAFARAGAQQFPRVADGIRAGRAGVGDDVDRAVKAERLGQHQRLVLRLVLRDTCGLAALRPRIFQCMTIIRFSQCHAAAGRAQHNRQTLRWLPAGLFPRFMRGQQQQPGRAVQTFLLPRGEPRRGQAGRQRRFAGHFHTLPAHIEERHRVQCNPPRPESFRVVLPADAERSDHSRAGDDDARRNGVMT